MAKKVTKWIWFPNLKFGKKNKSVKIVQQELIRKGFKIPAGATGYWGSQTQTAFNAFRRSVGLKGSDATGSPGPWSVRKLAYGQFWVRGVTNPVKTTAAKVVGKRASSPVSPAKGVTYAYGVRNRGYAAGFHTGEDRAVPTGTKAIAVRSGRVSYFWGGAYGNVARLDADNGRSYWYCHLSRKGKTGSVKAGDVIGYTGSTGNSTGPHLHLEDRPRGGGYANVRKPRW